ncbi:MAG: hypothetical protein H7Y38_03070 [Armatimonadetes bacterium]|nr:hypothetical protein [Armatimonadota bacterium]
MAETQTRTDLDLERYRAQLLELKKTIIVTEERMETQDADGLNTTGNDRAESSVAGNHPADMATELQIRMQDAALVENEQTMLRQIDAALVRLDGGTYGLSEVSGKPIPAERLDALPYATMTVEESETQE